MATTPSATPPSTPTIHCPVNYNNLNESWCDIRYKSGCSSSGSISHLHHTVNPEILEKLLYEAQREALSPIHSKTYPNMLPDTESSLVRGPNSNTDSLSNSIHNILDTSTPMLVTFDTSSKNISPKLDANIPASPINKIDEDIGKTLTSFNYTRIINSPVGHCTMCSKQKLQIEKLLEKHTETEKQLSLLRKEYEEKCLSKTPDFMSQSSSRSSISNSSLSEDQDKLNKEKKTQVDQIVNSLKRSNSSTATLVSIANTNSCNVQNTNTDLNTSFGYASGIYNYNSPNTESADWTKYWSSRPQTQPPKEWNLVHPNSAKSKLNSLRNMDDENDDEETKGIFAKYINTDNINKILFTHMASFIVGATLMFLVLRRHFSMRNSIYMK